MKNEKIIQGSDAWFKLRLGKFTASEIHKLMGAKGLGDTGNTYILDKVTEELTGNWEEISAPALDYGKLWEPFACEYYSQALHLKLKEDGFKQYCNHSGGSPDRLIVGQNKGIEVKCPYKMINHTKHLLIKNGEDLKKIRKEYYWQIQFLMLCYGFKEWDFVSFSNEFVGINRMIVVNIKQNNIDQNMLLERLKMAIEIKETYLKQINL